MRCGLRWGEGNKKPRVAGADCVRWDLDDESVFDLFADRNLSILERPCSPGEAVRCGDHPAHAEAICQLTIKFDGVTPVLVDETEVCIDLVHN